MRLVLACVAAVMVMVGCADHTPPVRYQITDYGYGQPSLHDVQMCDYNGGELIYYPTDNHWQCEVSFQEETK